MAIFLARVHRVFNGMVCNGKITLDFSVVINKLPLPSFNTLLAKFGIKIQLEKPRALNIFIF